MRQEAEADQPERAARLEARRFSRPARTNRAPWSLWAAMGKRMRLRLPRRNVGACGNVDRSGDALESAHTVRRDGHRVANCSTTERLGAGIPTGWVRWCRTRGERDIARRASWTFRCETRNPGPCSRSTTRGSHPADVVPRIFEPFRRGPQSGSHGLGLGLFIAERIVTAHGGRIELRSEAVQGTTFTIWLPLDPEIETAMAVETASASLA